MGDHATITLPEDSPPVEADAAAAGKDAAAEAAERVPYRDLFRYANVLDKILLVVGSLGSLVYGLQESSRGGHAGHGHASCSSAMSDSISLLSRRMDGDGAAAYAL